MFNNWFLQKKMLLRELLKSLFVEPLIKHKEDKKVFTTKKEYFLLMHCYKSNWHNLSNANLSKANIMTLGSDNWMIKDTKLACKANTDEQILRLTTHQLSEDNESCNVDVMFQVLEPSDLIYAGIILGAKTRIGINNTGQIFIGEFTSSKTIEPQVLKKGVRLALKITALKNNVTYTKLSALDPSGLTLVTLNTEQYKPVDWGGEIGLLSYCRAILKQEAIWFSHFNIEGKKVEYISKTDKYIYNIKNT